VQQNGIETPHKHRDALVYYYFFDPGTQFPGNEKITLCNTKKSTKIKLE